MDKKHFIKIETDSIEGIRDLWFENAKRFEKFSCVVSLDEKSSKVCDEQWIEEPNKKELRKFLKEEKSPFSEK
ncbi:MAG TPA: hypothetical protein ENI61_06200 [Ignavibacteria bacterium]|nr:hypothetical protein [Ignavibacteria bacterium]